MTGTGHRALGALPARTVAGAVASITVVLGMLVMPGETTGTVAASSHPTATPGTGAGSGASEGSWGATSANACEALDPSGCMLPFPNDFYTVADPATPTGRQVSFPPGVLPAATGQAPVDTTPYDHNDGFSPGSSILTHVPGLSLTRSGVATISDMGGSLGADSPVVLLDATTMRRWPNWSELDSNDPNPNTRLLLVHPARNLIEGHRYIVALRNLKMSSGATISPGAGFAQVLASRTEGGPLAPATVDHLRTVVTTLAAAGVPSRGLFLAWDFTVASRQNITGPAISMRDQAFAGLGSGVPSYTVTNVTDDPPADPSLAREVTGTFDVPSFLTGPAGEQGSQLVTGPNGMPVLNAGHTEVAGFDCEIPKAASGSRPARVGIYGHGLFGSSTEVYDSAVPQFSNEYDYVFCGTDWYGLSSNSIALAATVVTNLGEFPSLVDSLMQSLVDAQYLGRLLDRPDGFAANPAFQDAAHRPLLDPAAGLVYYGNSEGGIMGGAFTALSLDARRAVLGVPGMDYDVLLSRSADFSPFVGSLDHAYPSKAVQQLGFDLVQMLWDRGEADGYAEQMTGGLPGTPSHQVMLEEAFGDHQVANVTTETEARTLGASLREPALAHGRSNEQQPFWDLPPLSGGSKGPALTVWDSGVPPPPLTNTPPTAGPDPHDTVPRTVPAFWRQMNDFFVTGTAIDPCGSAPCRAPRP